MTVEYTVTDELCIEHKCKDCDSFRTVKQFKRKSTKEEVLKSLFTFEPVDRWEKVVRSIPNYCEEHEKAVDPEAAELCFTYSCSREIWLPEVYVQVENGKLKVTFER